MIIKLFVEFNVQIMNSKFDLVIDIRHKAIDKATKPVFVSDFMVHWKFVRLLVQLLEDHTEQVPVKCQLDYENQLCHTTYAA